MEKILRALFPFVLIPLFLNAEFAVKSYHEFRNENVIRQSYEQSCGASSLAALISMLDIKQLSELDVLEKMSENKNSLNTDMVSFKDLKETSAKLGYEAQGYRLDRNLFDKLNIPVLVKIENDPRFPHFVIAINHPGDFVTIMDPSFGEYVSLKSDFFKLWDRQSKGGYALILASNSGVLKEHKLNLPSKNLFLK
jgi:predicted double-glycine peptidase